MAAAVLFDLERIGPGEVRTLGSLNDSKQQTSEARAELYPVILRLAAKVAVITRCAPGIDARGLHVTNLAALRDALARVACPGAICLSDGFPVKALGYEQRAVIGGDATSAAIAAASVIAKETRDRYMRRADALHPGLGVRPPRRLRHSGAPLGHRAPGRLAAAPAVVSVRGLPAAVALGLGVGLGSVQASVSV